MDRRHRNLGIALAALTAGSTSCLTKALWNEEPKQPVLRTVLTECVIEDAYRTADRRGFAVAFTANAHDHTPGHLSHYSDDFPGLAEFRPTPNQGNWQDWRGSESFHPEWLEFRITRGSYFRGPHANARVVWHGAASPADFGSVIPPEQLPPQLAGFPTPQDLGAGSHWIDLCLAAFARHDWARLLNATTSAEAFRAEPFAWLDADGAIVDAPVPPEIPTTYPEQLANSDLADHSLLGRLTNPFGETLWVRIPARVLIQGEELQLARDEGDILWARWQIWRADLAKAADRPVGEPLPIPIGPTSFVYRWNYEIPVGETIPLPVRILLTPFAFALDLAMGPVYPYLDDPVPLPRRRK